MKKQLSLLFALPLAFATHAQDWSLTGNAGTNPATHFLGTTDNTPLMFRVNGIRSGFLDPGHQSAFVGMQAGAASTTAYGNAAFGHSAMESNTTGDFNGALGGWALRSNTIGSGNAAFGADALFANTTGDENVAIGRSALSNCLAGSGGVAIGAFAMSRMMPTSTTNDNVAVGYRALYGGPGSASTNTGHKNTAVGYEALSGTTTGIRNTAIGYATLMNMTTSWENTALGYNALTSATTGDCNTALGANTLANNTTGNYNIAVGGAGLSSNATGSSNVALGFNSLVSNATGNYNTALGRSANVSLGAFTNCTALGYNAIVNTSNKVRLGNSSVNVVEGQMSYTTPSDARFKRDVQEDVLGLDLILKLRPVSYRFDRLAFAKHVKEDTEGRESELVQASQVLTVGFLAQEVERTIEETRFTAFDAVHAPENPTDNYGLAYAQFVVPLVKAVQELHAQNEELREELERLREAVRHVSEGKGDDGRGQAKDRLQVYPDPAVDLLRIAVPADMIGKDAVLELVDGAGKRVLFQRAVAIPALMQLDLPSDLVVGPYLVSLRVEGAAARTARVIIAK
jgi:trimeric autotransporter adhesin